MAVPSKKQLLNWAEKYVSLWNAGDQEAWIANWKSVAPGEVRMLDPVGTPMKEGFEHAAKDSWKLFQGRVRFNIPDGCLFVNGNEVAWLLENHIEHDGQKTIGLSIETYRFNEDGSVDIKTYYRVPARDDSELGEMFQEYLPE